MKNSDNVMEKTFWEKTYSDMSITYCEKEPIVEIMKIPSLLKQGMCVLDIGCGDGRNAIYLAELGLNVDAFDISENGIDKLNRITAEKGIIVNAWVQDLTNYEFNKTYDVIICHGVLHLVEKHEWQRMIEKIMLNTNQNGLNIIGVLTNTLPAAPDLVPFTKALFNEGELRELYSGWDIIRFNSYFFEKEHLGGIHHKHVANSIIALKLSK